MGNTRVRKQQGDKENFLKWILKKELWIEGIGDLHKAENTRTMAKISYLDSDNKQEKIEKAEN